MPKLNFQQSSVQYADLALNKHFVIIIIINVVLLFVKFVKTVIFHIHFLWLKVLFKKNLAVPIL